MSLLRPWATGLPKRGWYLHSRVNAIAECSANAKGGTPLATGWGYHKVTHREHHKRTRAQSQLPASLSCFKSLLAQPSSESANMTLLAPQGEEKYRLPTNVKPTHYDITIRTDLEDLTFSGFVKIRCVLYRSVVALPVINVILSISLHIVRETSTISLNTSDLELSKAYVHDIQ